MYRRRRWTIRGVLAVVVGTTLLTTYLVVCLFGYGNAATSCWGLPQWFLAAFDYAVDETPLRMPILAAAELFGRREHHRTLSMVRRMRAWYRKHPSSTPDDSDGTYWQYYIDPELDEQLWSENDEIWQFLGLSTRAKPSLPSLNPPNPNFDISRTWEEVKLRLVSSKAEQRCLE